MGPSPRNFAVDAYDCIMVAILLDRPNTSLWRRTAPKWRVPLGSLHASNCTRRHRQRSSAWRSPPANTNNLSEAIGRLRPWQGKSHTSPPAGIPALPSRSYRLVPTGHHQVDGPRRLNAKMGRCA